MEAVAAWELSPYDVVLMDCHMPEMDGFEATAEIRKRETSGRHTGIIALTASAMDGERDRCIAAGMDDYISKPFRTSTLAEKLQKWIGAAARPEPVASLRP